jgi:hypothetical protein
MISCGAFAVVMRRRDWAAPNRDNWADPAATTHGYVFDYVVIGKIVGGRFNITGRLTRFYPSMYF